MAVGLFAIIGLTGMNVYSLYALHDNTVENSVEKQKRQLFEYTDQVRSRFRYPLNELWNLDMQDIRDSFTAPSEVSAELIGAIRTAGDDPLFSDIYLALPENNNSRETGEPVWRFNSTSGRFEDTREYNRHVRDGLAMAQTRMNAHINDYRWSTRIIFDSHFSMTIALVDSEYREIVGYLVFLIDREYLVDKFMAPKLVDMFGTGEEEGIIVWLHHWTNDEVLATTDPEVPYQYRQVDVIQNFPDLLNDWNLKASFTTNPDIAASRTTLTRNLLVLGGAVILLFAAMIVIFFTAQRERALAQRQTLFLANVTHELQTPLSVILAAGENLSDGRITNTERLKSYGKYIYRESIRLRTMIDRLLDVAKSNTDDLRIEKKPVQLAEFARKLLDEKQSYLESYQVELHFDADEDLPDIFMDPHDLQSIFNNLIDNAIKYSPGEKYLGIRIRKNKNHIDLVIEDHGMGISRQSQKYIFDKFFRVENALTAQTKGHGLGLTIVKDIISRNQGTIRVASTPKKGTTFTVSFPVMESREHTASDKINRSQLQTSEHVT